MAKKKKIKEKTKRIKFLSWQYYKILVKKELHNVVWFYVTVFAPSHIGSL